LLTALLAAIAGELERHIGLGGQLKSQKTTAATLRLDHRDDLAERWLPPLRIPIGIRFRS
jgi:hypothetical protein